MARYALTLAYDGRGLPGWQTQPSGNAVQDQLERALERIAAHPVATICAGRTDAGVHALRQVVHFDSASQRPDTAWVRGVNTHLPPAIAVRTVTRVADDFHARFGASRRRYRYLVHCSAIRHPLLAGRVGWTFRELDCERMRQAALLLAGEHDFSAFRSSECQAASPVRTLEPIVIRRHGPLLVFDFVGNAFLHHMIRNIMGSLLMVGDGRRPVSWLGDVLASRDRRLAAPTFDAHGLYLDGASYAARFGVPSWSEDGGIESLATAFA